MLEVLRRVLPGVGGVDVAGIVGVFAPGVGMVLNVGTVGVDCVCLVFGVGKPDRVTDRVCGFDGVTAPVPADVLGRSASSVCRSPY